MAKNTYVPAGLTGTRAYNWSRSAYSSSNVPSDTDSGDPGRRWQSTSAYEWLDYGQHIPGQHVSVRWETNPPFHEWEAGRLPKDFVAVDSSGKQVPARILRGYIRRAEYNVADRPSKARLYFMYNPEKIERQYVSYLDQGALDPFNTVYQSGNLVAPPSFMDFTFELFFDRQAEATSADHPGVLVDMEYFDLVVRNVIPGSEFTNGSIPDNGVMMVNPRDIAVIFSPTMSIQGRPLNASVVFEKFTHRMTPTRMRIALTMRVIYIGPPRDVTPFTQETINIERRVPFDIPEPARFTFIYEPLTWEENGEDLPNSSVRSDDWEDYGGTADNVGFTAMKKAAEKAGITDANPKSTTMKYDAEGGRHKLWDSGDCSSFVWGGFMWDPGSSSYGAQLGWPKFSEGVNGTKYIPATITMKDAFGAADEKLVMRLYGFNQTVAGVDSPQNDSSLAYERIQKMSPGDILMRVNHPRKPDKNHIAFLWKVESNGFWVLHAASSSDGVCLTQYSSGSDIKYNYGCRVIAAGSFDANAEEDED